MIDKILIDIKNIYLKENNINYKKGKFEISEITHDINGILFTFLNSYYFEKLNDFKFIKTINDNNEDYFYIRSVKNKFDSDPIKIELNREDINLVKEYFKNKDLNNFKKISLNKSFDSGVFFLNINEIKEIFNNVPFTAYQEIFDVFNFEIDSFNDSPNKNFYFKNPYFNSFSIHNIELNEKMKKTIKKLKEDPYYETIFESDEIKKIINLKNRHDFKISILDIKNNNNEEISKLSKISNDYSLKSDLSKLYGLKYFPLNRDNEFKSIVAHNDLEIAGVLSLCPPYENNIKKDSCLYLSYVSVCQSFYGEKLGMKMVESALDYIEKNKFVLFRTSSSNDGEKYIKDKITQIGIDRKIPIISYEERNLIIKILEKIKDKNNDYIYNFTNNVLDYARKNYNESELESGLYNKKIIDLFINDKIKLKKPTKS